MINANRVDELIEVVADYVNCFCCPCKDECPYSYLGGKQECIKKLHAWVREI